MSIYYPADRPGLNTKAPSADPQFTGDPKAPTPNAGDNDTSVATTAFVKDAVDQATAVLSSGSVKSIKASALVATTEHITLSGEQIIDGVQTDQSRVLVKDQTIPVQNGIYLSGPGPWVRTSDADTDSDVIPGMLVFAEQGELNGAQVFVCTNSGDISIGTTELSFAKLDGGGAHFIGKLVNEGSYVHSAADHGRRLEFLHHDPKTFTLAPNSAEPTPLDTTIQLLNVSSPVLSVSLGTGVTLQGVDGDFELLQYQGATLVKRGMPDTWIVSGFYNSSGPGIGGGGGVSDGTAPATPLGLIVIPGHRSLNLRWDRNSERDLSHYEVFQGDSADDTPAFLDAGHYETVTNAFPVSGLDNDQELWFWIRAVDYAGNKSGWSVPANGTTTPLQSDDLDEAIDFEAPGIPTGLELSSTINADGQTATLVASWEDNQENDFLYYIVQIRQGDGNWQSFQTVDPYREWTPVLPNTTFTVQIQAVDRAGNKSSPCEPETHTTALDTVPPSPPTGFTLSAGLDAIWLKWINPPEKDFSHIEILESETPVLADAQILAIAWGTTFIRGSLGLAEERYYWIRSVDTSGNISDPTGPEGGTTGTIPDPLQITVSGITFKPGDGGTNRLSWTTGEISYGIPGEAPETRSISAGFVDWSSGSVYIYYVPGNLSLSHTTNIVTVYASNGIVMGVYKGGLNFQLVQGKAFMDGGLILAQTIGANHLVTNQAVITGAAQIANAIISDAHITNVSAGKIIAGSVMTPEVIVNGRSIGSMGTTDVLFDNVERDWTVISGRGHYYSSSSADSVSGGRSLVSPASSFAALSPEIVAFDPGKLYRVTFRIRNVTRNANPNRFYLGVVGLAADRTTYVNTVGTNSPYQQHYAVVSGAYNLDAPSTLTEFVGYIKGHSTSAGGVGPSPSSPAKMHPDVRYIRPLAYFNVESGTPDVMVLDSVKVETLTEEAAAIVNAGTTTILPGKIEIYGGTTLEGWKAGPDKTTINGGKIEADSVSANAMQIGQRGINIEGIAFEANRRSVGSATVYANDFAWTSGVIEYVDDNGTKTYRNIAANWSSHLGGVAYVYWIKGETLLRTSASYVDAIGPDRIGIGVYRGGSDLTVTYGRTIIDGPNMSLGSITADRANIADFQAHVVVADDVISKLADFEYVSTRNLVVKDKPKTVNADPFFRDYDLWETDPGITGSAYIAETTDGTGGTVIVANGQSIFTNQKIALDPDKQYLIEIKLRSSHWNLRFYGIFRFYNPSDQPIGNQGGSWAYDNGNHYFPSYQAVPTTMTEYSAVIGAGTTRPIPADTAYVLIGWLANYDNYVGGYQVIDYFKITELIRGVEIKDNEIDTPHLKAGSVKTNTLDAGAATLDKLSVTARNLLNDPGMSNSVEGWDIGGSVGLLPSEIITISSGPPVTRGIQLTTTGSLYRLTDYIPIDPYRTYRVTAAVWDNRSTTGSPGLTYWLVGGYDSAGAFIVNDLFHYVTRVQLADSAYPWYGAANGWRVMETYIAGSNVDINHVPASVNANFMKFKPNARFVRFGVYNLDNGGVNQTVYAGNFVLHEIDSGKIVASQMEVASLSAITANLGTVVVKNANIENGAVTSSKRWALSVS